MVMTDEPVVPEPAAAVAVAFWADPLEALEEPAEDPIVSPFAMVRAVIVPEMGAVTVRLAAFSLAVSNAIWASVTWAWAAVTESSALSMACLAALMSR
jgi:hypothetical protein